MHRYVSISMNRYIYKSIHRLIDLEARSSMPGPAQMKEKQIDPLINLSIQHFIDESASLLIASMGKRFVDLSLRRQTHGTFQGELVRR